MPHVIGAIDRKHVQIICPKNTGNLYETTRDFLALFYQLSVTLITALRCSFVGQYGSNNGSGVLIQSNMAGYFEDHSNNIPQPESDEGCDFGPVPYLLVEDEILPHKTWLVRPNPGKLAEQERVFNDHL